MRRVKTHLFWLGLLALLSVSAVIAAGQESSAAPSTATNSAKATVYVYRYKQFVGAALAPSVYCDDVELARMENGRRYFMATLEPGKHTFRQSGVVLEMKAGEQYYMRVEIATGFMKGHGRLVLMPREQASYELVSTKLKPLDGNKVADKERVSVQEAHPQAAAPAAAAPKAVEVAPDTATPATTTVPAVEEHPVTGTTVSNGGATSSMMGDHMSLGDAARLARQKKQQQQPQQ
jgi:uncharacterized protein DUF2846